MAQLSIAADSAVAYNGAVPLLPKFAVISASASGDNTVVAAVAGKKIRVLAAVTVMTGTTVSQTWKSANGGTAISGAMTPLQGGVIPLPYNPLGWFETIAGQLLNLSLGGAQAVGGAVVYVEV